MIEKEINDFVDSVMTITPVIFKKMHKMQNEILQKKKLTQTHVDILFIIKREKMITMTELGNILCISKPNVTTLIDKLFLLDLVERIYDEKDRRLVLIKLSVNGIKFIEEFKNEFKNSLIQILKKLDENDLEILKTITDLVNKLVDKFEFKNGG